MIVDVHSHFFRYPDHFTAGFREQAKRARSGVEVDLTVRFDEYRATCPSELATTVVFGGKARLSGLWVNDQDVADYVASHADKLIGFLSVDPTQEGWQDEMRDGHQRLGLRGIKLLPMYAGFFPDDSMLDPLWQYASKHQLPVLLHTGTTFVSQAPLECTLPRHVDVVARRFPDVRIIMAHLGHPYEGECIAVIRKHDHVYADISALHYRPFQFYHSLMLVQEYGVWHKLLFGTDYPFTTVNATLETLGKLSEMFAVSAAGQLDAQSIHQMLHRDTLGLLGLSKTA